MNPSMILRFMQSIASQVGGQVLSVNDLRRTLYTEHDECCLEHFPKHK